MWSIKDQEIYDKHSGLHLRFASHEGDKATVYLQVTHPASGNGTQLSFHRDGEVLTVTRIQPAPAAEGVGDPDGTQTLNFDGPSAPDATPCDACMQTSDAGWKFCPHCGAEKGVAPDAVDFDGPLVDNNLLDPSAPDA